MDLSVVWKYVLAPTRTPIVVLLPASGGNELPFSDMSGVYVFGGLHGFKKAFFCNVDLFFTSAQMMTHISLGALIDLIFKQRHGETEDMRMWLHKASFCSYVAGLSILLAFTNSVGHGY